MALRVVVVDDDPEQRRELTDRLSQEGFVVFAPQAEDGDLAAAALETALGDGYAAVVCDLLLSGGGTRSVANGIKMLAELKRRRPNLRILAYTESVEQSVFQHLRKVGLEAGYLKDDPNGLDGIVAKLKAQGG